MKASWAAVSEVASLGLFSLDGLEQALEITGSEALQDKNLDFKTTQRVKKIFTHVVVVPLDNFKENSWPVLNVSRKQLKKVAVFIKVDQDIEFFQLKKVKWKNHCDQHCEKNSKLSEFRNTEKTKHGKSRSKKERKDQVRK